MFQELEHLEIFLKHCTDKTLIGQLLRQSAEALRLEVGLPGNITDWDYKKWESCVTDCWCKRFGNSAGKMGYASRMTLIKPIHYGTGTDILWKCLLTAKR